MAHRSPRVSRVDRADAAAAGVVTIALAVWVKTPGHTPAKTRLAKAIGAAAAEAFYRLAVEAVRELVEDACRLAPELLVPYWAIAEKEDAARAQWSGFPVVAQGDGSLGERLANVYDILVGRHQAVIFIGADSPQLDPAVLIEAATLLARSSGRQEFVIGPAADGGFYLFGGHGQIPRRAWLSVTYSAATTRGELIASLEPMGRVHLLSSAFDVDTIDELHLLRDTLAAAPESGAARRALRDWLESLHRQ